MGNPDEAVGGERAAKAGATCFEPPLSRKAPDLECLR
jgi:hypothetical protein